MEIVGAEYLIGNAIISRIKQGKELIAITDIRSLGEQMQYSFHKDNKAVLVNRSDLINTIKSFSEYFELLEVNDTYYVRAKNNKTLHDLQARFQGYLKLDTILKIIDICDSFKYSE